MRSTLGRGRPLVARSGVIATLAFVAAACGSAGGATEPGHDGGGASDAVSTHADATRPAPDANVASDARADALRGHDAGSGSGQDSGSSSGQDAGEDAGVDAGVDSGRHVDAGVAVDAGSGAMHDAGASRDAEGDAHGAGHPDTGVDAGNGCGDGVIKGGEVCNGTALGGATCASVLKVAATGTLACSSNCESFNVAGCVCPGGESICGAATPTCTSLQTDSSNCGACGDVCAAGATCSLGHCTTVLATGLTAPIGVAVDATQVYFANDGDGKIYALPKTGGAPKSLVTSGQTTGAWEISLAGTSLYWSTYNAEAILMIPVTGGAAVTVSSSEYVPEGIVNDGTTLFWADSWQQNPLIRKANLTTPTPVTVEAPVGGNIVVAPASLAVDANYVYWGNEVPGTAVSNVYRAAKDGSNPFMLASGIDGVNGITVDASTIYVSTITGSILSIPIGGGAATPISTMEPQVAAVVNDATAVYWVTVSTVRKMTKVGGALTTLSTCAGNVLTKSPGCGRFRYLALDTDNVYWTDSGTQYGQGAVYSVPKN